MDLAQSFYTMISEIPYMSNQELIDKYSPVVHFHPEEEYFPCSVDYYLDHSRLLENDTLVMEKGSLTKSFLSKFTSKKDYVLQVDNDAIHGQKESLDTVPLYATVKRHKFLTQIQYIFFYAYNGAYDVFGQKIGAHYCDIERVSLVISNDSGKIKKLYYGAHRYRDGLWVENIPYDRDGKPIIYVAKFSHATYPDAKSWSRYFCFANDVTSDSGVVWKPSNIVYIDEKTDWNMFTGSMGYPNNCPTPLYHSWFRKEDGESTNWFKRIFCCY